MESVKKPKKSKFGRAELRSVTRTSKRKIPEIYRKNETVTQETDSETDTEDLEDVDEVESTIASKRNNKGENKMAYSALVTLLNTEHSTTEFANNEENEKRDEGDDDEIEEDEQVHEIEDKDDVLDEEDRIQDEIDVLNKYDAFNLHFNQEEEIGSVISKFEKLSEKDKRLHLISKKKIKIKEGDKHDDDHYIKYKYGYPQVNDRVTKEPNSGSTLDRKLKYHNVKKRVVERFENLEDDIGELDLNLIESMFTYETLNLQYMNNETLKSKYQDYYLLHIMNHLMKTRDRILNNNEKKALHEKRMKEGELEEDEVEPEYRDQGYTRPKVLILLPSRNFAYNLVNKLIKTLKMESVENKKKFKTQFYVESKIKDRVFNPKPKDFEEYFDGNTNDMFVLGIKYTRKTLKLYSPLEQSDIIIASPVGLLKLYDKINMKTPKKEDKKGVIGMKNNFLSSIEICIIDKAEGLMMQNWSNVTELLNKHLNKTPKDFINVDFSRIRMWAINGQNDYLTQIMCFDKYVTPEMVSLVKRSKNVMSGATSYIPIESMNKIDSFNYEMYQMGLVNKFERLKQVFMRFDIDIGHITNEPDKRFDFFKNVVLPQITNKSSYKYGTLVYIPNYFDYLRIKKHLKNETSLTFVAIDEYSTTSQLTRNRALFHNKSNLAPIMLYTERLHFYKRFDIKGVRNVVFYQLPSDPDFYKQVLKFIGDEKLRIDTEKSKLSLKKGAETDNNEEEQDDDEEFDSLDLNLCMVRAIYSKLDAMRLGPIVGPANVSSLSNGEAEITEFS
ncbi:hypothetical protein CANINC_003454 [Pichia inconspicua]|uniref:U3 small nucleolar RNA-associated protein 25 n=1 Tax=Pichia inconspicua TaxID=52247 RepID=A0A4T0WYK3_9ASCO|nr:hypothetical protein CANINC_003454 [[Candida] inconspicua]